MGIPWQLWLVGGMCWIALLAIADAIYERTHKDGER